MEWGDCALDDDDRDKGILIRVETKVADYPNKALARKHLKSKLVAKYDQWIRETRG